MKKAAKFDSGDAIGLKTTARLNTNTP